jgi:hypothetical protein
MFKDRELLIHRAERVFLSMRARSARLDGAIDLEQGDHS